MELYSTLAHVKCLSYWTKLKWITFKSILSSDFMLQLIQIECKYLTGKHETNEIVNFSIITDPISLFVVDGQKRFFFNLEIFQNDSKFERSTLDLCKWQPLIYSSTAWNRTVTSKTCLLNNSARLSSHFNLVIKTLFFMLSIFILV